MRSVTWMDGFAFGSATAGHLDLFNATYGKVYIMKSRRAIAE